MRIIGTAGHVDHGKSTLVRALTGIDPDRLREEKARGMTIDLGFAWFDLPLPQADAPETIGVVDVPGHIDFIKNMLAGVGGIDAALFVIAADEGVMPQTREHLAILDLLAVPAALVAMTKVDLVDDAEWLDLVELDIMDLLSETRFAQAKVVRLSAMTGEGMGDLRIALGSLLADLTPRRDRARPRLPIDRVFSLSGFGTIVTGTLLDGSFTVGDAVEILPRPEGSRRSARIRGLQTHKQQVDVGATGSRLAMNLSGIGVEDIRRGDVVVRPGSIEPTRLVDVSVRMLPGASRPLRHNMAADFFAGAAETPAIARLLGAEELKGGDSGWLQLRLAEPVVVAAGDRFILRQPSPSETLGGGVVLNPHPRRRWRRFDPRVLERLKILERGAPDEVILDALSAHPCQTPEELAGSSGLDLALANDTVVDLLNQGALVWFEESRNAEAPRLLLTVAQRTQILAALERTLRAYHSAYPLRNSMPRGEARSKVQEAITVPIPVRLFNAIVECAQTDGMVLADDSSIWLAEHRVRLSADQQQRVDRTLGMLADGGYSPPAVHDLMQTLEGDEELMEMMVAKRLVVRMGGVVYRLEEFEQMVAAVREYIAAHGSMTLAEARDHFGASRRTVQAVLEEMDARRITRREGETRVLR